MGKNYRICSISEPQADRFAKTASEKATLWCANLTGLHLIRIKSGASWRYRFTDHDGRQKTYTLGRLWALNPEQAAEKVKDWKDKGIDPFLQRKQKTEKKAQDTKASEARTLQNYLEDRYQKKTLKAWKEENAKIQLGRIKNHFEFLLNRDMSSISGPRDITPWQESMTEAGRAHSTINRTLGALKALLNQAVKDEVLEISPLANYQLDAPSLDQQDRMETDSRKEQRRPLTDKEISALFEAIEQFDKEFRRKRKNSRSHGKPHLADLDNLPFAHWFVPFFYVALYTGMRVGDLFTLKWADLDLDRQRLQKITEKSVYRRRQGKKPIEIELFLPKQLLSILKQWDAQSNLQKSGFIFPNPATGAPMSAKAHQRHWATIRTKAGLSDRIVFYSLRHNWISRLVADGRPLLEVAKMAGQTSVQMIEDHYGHLMPEKAESALTALADSMPPPKHS